MRWLRFILCCTTLLYLFVPHIVAQSQKDPLNDDEVDQVREFGDRPNERIKLFAKFIEQRITAIRQLSTDKHAENRAAELRAKIEEFTRLSDELQDNLDTYDQQHADIRKALKELVPQSDKWEAALNLPGPDPNYDFARKTAVEAAKSVNEQMKDLQKDQEKYFAEHKDQAGKNGTGPQ
jgi:exonuclease VII large subunit